MCFADRSGIGRAQIREEPVESLFTVLHQWHPDLSEGCTGRDSILNILNFQLIHSCCGPGVAVGGCTLCSAVLSVQGASVRRLLQLHGEMLSCSPGGQGN